MLRFILIFVIALFSSPLYTQNPYFFSVKPKTGEGILDLLERYQLNDSDCNINKFYELNNLSKGENLYLHKSYKIPVKIFQYNGKSIRSTINNPDYDNAVDIQNYNLSILAAGLRKTDYRKSNILWVPFSHLACADQAQNNENLITVELFGEPYMTFEKIDNTLQSHVYYLTSGHGGPDPGAIGNYQNASLCEDEYAYDVTLRLAKKLLQHGAKVHIIIQDPNDGIRNTSVLNCDYDEITVNHGEIPLNQLKRLEQRTTAINNLYYKNRRKGYKKHTAVIIHVDSRRPTQRLDVFFMHYKKSDKGKILASNLQDTFQDKYKINRTNGNYDGDVETRNLYLLRETFPPAVFIELGNIRNVRDQKRILLKSNRQALADWIYEGLNKARHAITMN